MSELQPNQVMIGGKIVETRYTNNTHYTQVILPAPDEYSNPQRVEISSTKRLGNKEDQILQLCNVGGFLGKEFTVTDKQTGEKLQRRSVTIVLRAAE